MSETLTELVQDTRLNQVNKALQKEIEDRKTDIISLNNRFESNLKGLEESLSEFEHVSKKFKREKSDIMIMKDSLKTDIEKVNDKVENSNTAITNLSKFCLNLTELLKISHEFKMHKNFSENGVNTHSQYMGLSKRLPPIINDSGSFSMSKKYFCFLKFIAIHETNLV